MHPCTLTSTVPDLPDTGEVCCYGVAIYGPERCTCWVPQYDLDQRPPVPAPAPPVTRSRMCGDCAFRPGSPERTGADGYANSDDGELDELVASARPFYCHQGMRQPAAWQHPSGMVIPGEPGAYDPPLVDGVPYQADGTPAEVCAGWAARRRALAGVRGPV